MIELTPAANVMVDTNILVYLTEVNAPHHSDVLRVLGKIESAGVTLWISRQILREFIAARSREQVFSRPVPIIVLEEMLEDLRRRFQIVEDGPPVTVKLLQILREVHAGGKQVHDANIVATMLSHGITQVLTNNVSDFSRFANYISVVPLIQLTSPK